mmetsp:Transcript_133919/g.317518  ORF Transcript_133919/g.317518 Transcript_133919/m.317518 type:complete len:205 (-) Transcript_133919:126-740(-)
MSALQWCVAGSVTFKSCQVHSVAGAAFKSPNQWSNCFIKDAYSSCASSVSLFASPAWKAALTASSLVLVPKNANPCLSSSWSMLPLWSASKRSKPAWDPAARQQQRPRLPCLTATSCCSSMAERSLARRTKSLRSFPKSSPTASLKSAMWSCVRLALARSDSKTCARASASLSRTVSTACAMSWLVAMDSAPRSLSKPAPFMST